MDDLEDSLKRLFQDSRLDVRAAPDAEKVLVSGARRLRRRRIALISTAGTLSLALLAGGAFLIARPAPQGTEVATQPSDLPLITSEQPPPSTDASKSEQLASPTQATSSTRRADTPPQTSAAAEVKPGVFVAADLGPSGFGNFRLGMTSEQVSATNQIRGAAPTAGSCAEFQIQGMDRTSTLVVSRRYGLVAITLTANARTPQRIGIGSTEDQVRSAYRSTTTVTVPENPNASYQFRFAAGKVSSMTLIAKTQDCQ